MEQLNQKLHNQLEKGRIRPIAFYLPQFHPIPENDEWWGKGFTEWTNVGKAKPLFKGHYQPRVPADLGYYDLRLPEVREAQACMAKEAGIEGFCYWHYWFGNGKMLLERPFNEVLISEKPDFPFCLAWANETWSGIWHGLSNKILIEQTYPGESDFIEHYRYVRRAFLDKRYICVDNKPLFILYHPFEIPDLPHFIQLWNSLAKEDGLEGIHFVALSDSVSPEKEKLFSMGIDAIICNRLWFASENARLSFSRIKRFLRKWKYKGMKVYDYGDVIPHLLREEESYEQFYPVALPNWDHSPRAGKNSVILVNSTPELFEKHVSDILSKIENKNPEHQIVFVKSWNEWAEGNYLEPDLRFGMQYLEALKRALSQTPVK